MSSDAIVIKEKNNDEYILLVKRKNNPYKGELALPGGFVEYNEEPRMAAIREL